VRHVRAAGAAWLALCTWACSAQAPGAPAPNVSIHEVTAAAAVTATPVGPLLLDLRGVRLPVGAQFMRVFILPVDGRQPVLPSTYFVGSVGRGESSGPYDNPGQRYTFEVQDVLSRLNQTGIKLDPKKVRIVVEAIGRDGFPAGEAPSIASVHLENVQR
jgi:hypothetical protein